MLPNLSKHLSHFYIFQVTIYFFYIHHIFYVQAKVEVAVKAKEKYRLAKPKD